MLFRLVQDAQTPEQVQQMFDDGVTDAITKCVTAHPTRGALQVRVCGCVCELCVWVL